MKLTQAFPDRELSGIGGISGFDQALSYFLLGCGTVQIATAAMLDHAIGPNVIAAPTQGMTGFLERNADRGWTSLADFRGLRRGRMVPHSQIGRPDASEYHGGYDEEAEGYAFEMPARQEPAGRGRVAFRARRARSPAFRHAGPRTSRHLARRYPTPRCP